MKKQPLKSGELKNKKTSLTDPDKNPLSYADLIKFVVNSPVAGMNTEEIRKRVALLDRVEKAKTTIDFSGTDINLLKTLVSNFSGWSSVNTEILTFEDDIKAIS